LTRIQPSIPFRVLPVAWRPRPVFFCTPRAPLPFYAQRGSVAPLSLVHVISVSSTPDYVYLHGGTSSPAMYYRAYDAEVVDGVMTVSLRYSFFGDGFGEFDLRIPTGGERIESVYLKGGGSRRRVYPDPAS